MKKFLILIFLIYNFNLFAQTYPISKGLNTNYEWITNVTLENINNSTNAGSGYDDFTSISTKLLTNTTYILSVTIHVDPNNPHEYINAWIDWNDDGDFDDINENYIIATNTNQNGPHTINITTENHVGELRMRVTLKWNSAADNDETFTYGEVEDYTINTYRWYLSTSLGDWDIDGVPNYLETTNDLITATDIDSLLGTYSNDPNTARIYLNEGNDLTTFNNNFVQTTDIELTSNDSVWVTFITESAGNKNTLAYYTYTTKPTKIEDIDTIRIIYPNSSSNGSGGNLIKGNKVFIGKFPSGTKIGWCLFSNAWNNDSTTYVNSLPNWTNTYYSTDSSFNLNNYDHTALFKYKHYDKWILSFEDLNLGDKDYADVLYWITTTSGDFTLLPIKLLNYNYNYKTKNIEWSTIIEQNNDYFSINIINKDGLIKNTYYVNGAGNSNILQKYKLNINESNVYVQVTQTDYDGNENYLFTLYIQDKKDKDIYIIHNYDYIEIIGDFNDIEIFSINGMKISYRKINNKIYLNHGIYIIIIDNKSYKIIF